MTLVLAGTALALALVVGVAVGRSNAVAGMLAALGVLIAAVGGYVLLVSAMWRM
jgi:hypothetical protein